MTGPDAMTDAAAPSHAEGTPVVRSRPTRDLAIATVTALAGLAVVAQLYLPLPLLGQIAAKLDTSPAGAAWTSSAFGLAYAGGFLLAGPLSDRFGRRRVMIPALLALALASLLAAAATGLPELLAARVLQGLAAAGLPPVAIAYLGEVLAPQRRLLGLSLLSAAFLLAGPLGQLYGGAFAASTPGLARLAGPLPEALDGGLTPALLGLMPVYLLLAGLLALLPGAGPRAGARAGASAGARAGAGAPAGTLADNLAALPGLLRRPALRPLYGAATLLLLAFVALFTALERGLGALAPAQLAGLQGAAAPVMALALAMPLLSARLGAVRAVRASLATAAAGLGLAALVTTAWATSALAPAPGWLLAASGLFVAGLALSVPGVIALVGARAPERRGSATALYTFLLFVGASLGAQLPGWLAGLGPLALLAPPALGLALAAATLGPRAPIGRE